MINMSMRMANIQLNTNTGKGNVSNKQHLHNAIVLKNTPK